MPAEASINFYGKPVYVALRGAEFGKVSERLAQLGAYVVNSRLEAAVAVVANPARPGQRLSWHAALCGCAIVCPQTVLGGQGPALVWSPAVRRRRRLWTSRAWAAAHPTLAEILAAALRAVDSQWVRLSTKALFMASLRRSRLSEVVGLVTKAEKRSKAGLTT